MMITSARRTNHVVWGFLAILVVGIALRGVFLSIHGIDADDTFSLIVAQHPYIDFLKHFTEFGGDLVIDIHGKIYYLLYSPWLALTGVNHVSARTLNILFEGLLGAFLLSSIRSLFSARIALITGILWAFSPTLIANVEIMRMYSLLALLATVGWVFLVRAVHQRSLKLWIVSGAGVLAAAYTHVMGIVALFAAGFATLFFSLFDARKQPEPSPAVGAETDKSYASPSWLRRKTLPLVVMALAGLLYLPYFLNLWEVRSAPRSLVAAPISDPLTFLRLLARGLVANALPLSEATQWGLAALCVTMLIVAAWSARRDIRTGGILILILAAIGGAGYFALEQAVFQIKYVSYMTPLLLVGLAIGIAHLPYRSLKAGVLAVVVMFQAAGIYANLSPAIRDNYPDAARVLDTYADSGDLAVVMTSRAKAPLDYYYHGETPVVAPWFDIKKQVDIRKELRPGRHDTTWLILYAADIYDPNGRLDTWFRDRYPLRTEAYPTGLTIHAYDTRPMTTSLPPEAKPLNSVFNQQLALRGYQTYESALSAHDNRLHPPSGWAHVTLYWEALKPGIDFVPVTQMEDALGQVWGINLTRGNDVFAFYPAATWQPGQIWRSDADVNLNPATPPGQYNLVVRAIAPGAGEFWADENGETGVVISAITITP